MWVAALVLLWGIGQSGEVRGVVLDARSGEGLARVRVSLLGRAWETLTDDRGRFGFTGVAPGEYTLRVATVGYRMIRRKFTLSPGAIQEFEVILSPDTFRQTDSVEVRADPFEPVRAGSPVELSLEGSEVKNLGSVLADDPLRAAQALPGVRSNDDFDSRFSLRGASFERIGLYLDDVLLHVPFHTLQGEAATGSMTLFNGEMVETLALHAAAPPVMFADRTAGVLDVRLREGSRTMRSVRISASASNAGVLAEGPLGASRRGAWMVSARKSYFQYIIRRTATSEPTIAFGFADVQGRLTYEPAAAHRLELSILEGFADLDRTRSRSRLGVNSVMLADNHVTLASLGWRFTPRSDLLASSRVAWMRERFSNLSREEWPLAGGYYGEWVWNAQGSWMWSRISSLDFGWSLRRIRADGFIYRYQFNPFLVRPLDEYRGHGLRSGGYLRQSVSAGTGRVELNAGLRWDRHSVTAASTMTPVAALSLTWRPGTRLHLGWGQYAQFPDLHWLFSFLGGNRLRPERAMHATAALEQRLGARSRLRLEVYHRQDRDLLFRPWYEPRLLGGRVFNPPGIAPAENSLRGWSRGLEVFLQQRSANRLTGWISYAWGRTRLRDSVTGAVFPADFDQRHSVNIYLSYRLRPTANLSTRWIYGSGFPIPGYLRRQGDRYFLAAERNRLRLPSYHRADLRIHKAYVFDRWKLTLYGEVINISNHANYRFDSFNGYNARTGQAAITLDKMFPIIPSAGLALEF